jgi:hypothetical protein
MIGRLVGWKDLRAVLVWMVVLVLGGLVVGGGYVAYLLTQVDRLLTLEVQRQLTEIAPDWQVNFRQLRFDPAGELTLQTVEVHAREVPAAAPLVKIRQLRIELDRELWQSQQLLVVQRVRIEDPEIYLHRRGDGSWNLEDGAPPKTDSDSSPEVVITGGKLRLDWESAPGGAVRSFRAEELAVQLRPAGFRKYDWDASSLITGLGAVGWQGKFDQPRGTWNVAGQLRGLRISDELLSQVASLIPGGDAGLSQLGITPTQLPGGTGSVVADRSRSSFPQGPPVGLATAGGETERSSSAVPAVRAEAEVRFELGKSARDANLDYALVAHLERGTISDAVLPIPLFDLSADVEVRPGLIRVQKLQAANGDSRLAFDGEFVAAGAVWQKVINLRATQLELDERICRYLPAGLLKVYELVQPRGRFELGLGVQDRGEGVPEVACEFTALNCAARFAHFPYPIERVQGTIQKEGTSFRVNLRGRAGEQPVSLIGYIVPNGLQTDAKFRVQASGIPLDDRVKQALQTRELRGVEQTLESLNLSGRGDVVAEFVRRPGLDEKFQLKLELELREGTVRFERFPFPLNGFSGKLTYDSLKRRAFIFTNLEARHADALIRAEGIFDQETDPPMLAMQMELLNIPIDSDLRQASTVADPDLEQIWTDYGLDGYVDVDRVELGWIPGGNAVVSLYGMQWKNGRLKPKALPYSWENIAGALQWVDGRLTIHSLHGWHGDTYLHIDGTSNGAAAYIDTEVGPDLSWQLHADSLQIVKLRASEDLRRALPSGVQSVVETLNISGPMDLQLGIDLKGWKKGDLVTAEWSSLLALPGNRLTAGLELRDVVGRVQVLKGSWNGRSAIVDGYIELDTARVLDLPLTNIRGPFKVTGNEVLVGSPGEGDASPFLEGNRYRDRKLTADFFSGRVGLQSIVLMAPNRLEELQYRVDLKLEDAELAELARYKGIQQERLSGKVNGETTLTGQGTAATNVRGAGWVHITPAQLFELPVFAQMFSLINFRQPSDTAFNYAYGEFTVQEGVVDFSTIELYGPSLNLGGKGYVGFAGSQNSRLALDFYTQGKRRLLQPLTDRWMRIQVVGTVNNPIPVVQPRIPVLNDALEGFMRAVDSGTVPAPRRQPSPPPAWPPQATRQAVPQ